ncbi:MAG: mevalonate kinase [Oligoflexia bacterium]|nr:mevalonate kinase [Oligoflexia bacterium]MBF0366222.1 mevalonate kinase [Oligoflexia bacterium]
MKKVAKNFPAKIILFGEYSIIIGSQALAIPYHNFCGHLACNEINNEDNESDESRPQTLLGFYQFLSANSALAQELDLPRLYEDLQQHHLYFDSTIPEGYGLGSSGALCAAIWDGYGRCIENDSLLRSKKRFGMMEAFFHGKSSGLDPLVSYIDTPILMKSEELILPATMPAVSADDYQLFLINTQRKKSTGHYVKLFLERYSQDANFKKECDSILIPTNNALIESFLAATKDGAHERFCDLFFKLSSFQINYFDAMILPEFKALWEQGLKTQNYALKLCGSGGGGLLLGVAPATRRQFIPKEALMLNPIAL